VDSSDPALAQLIERVQNATRTGTALNIIGGGSKSFYGESSSGEPLDVRTLRGISSYESTELVVTARCGTLLAELEATLAERGQCLAFEPPHFGEPGQSEATVGGMVAAGLSGPARVSVGSVRDYVLGATLLNGRGEVLSFGGQVMKNVAGYDVARLLVGALGILGVICEVSLKVLPIAPATCTLSFELDAKTALRSVNQWAAVPLPLNASAWISGRLHVRLKGATAAVDAAARRLGGEVVESQVGIEFWNQIRNHRHPFFDSTKKATLWRVSVPATSDSLSLPGEQLIEWHGAQRWCRTDASAAEVRKFATQSGGHATLFYARDKSAGVFTRLEDPLDRIHRDLKKSFDPAGIFNRGRMYPHF
jgi:glycolate oxidase FAD binding subunit